jgi:hypothetical protein
VCVCAYAGALDKAHFNYGGPDPWRPNISQSPWEGKMQDSMESYSCPAGSVLIFTESLIHASNDWLLPNPRVAVFNCCEYLLPTYRTALCCALLCSTPLLSSARTNI